MRRIRIVLLLAAALGLVVIALRRHTAGTDAHAARAIRSPRLAQALSTAETDRAFVPADAVAASTPAQAAFDRATKARRARAKETVLHFRSAAALARFLAQAGKYGATVLAELDGLNALRLRIDDPARFRSALGDANNDIDEVSANYLFSVPSLPAKVDRPAVPQIPFGTDALAFIGATGDRSNWGRGVTIAVVDTGVGADPTFGAGRVTTLDIGRGTQPGDGKEDGHGTSVASLAAGAAPDAAGVAPGADVLSIRVTDATGQSDIFTIAQAIVAAADAGANIINVSLGGYATNAVLDNAIAYATSRGVAIVAAAGNDQAAQLDWPAADPRVISVGAVDKSGQQVSFSNSGPQLQLTAPGLGVQTAWSDGQRAWVDGTSASAPLVAGSMAALMSQNPSLTATAAAALLTKTASDAGAPGADSDYGSGIVNLSWAMNVNNPAYVDTAIASHYYDAQTHQMDFVIQNRSGQTVSGLTLGVTANGAQTAYTIGPLTPGQSQVVTMPVDVAQVTASGGIQYTTTLTNPPGIVDQQPANNRRTSVLQPPTP